MSSTKTSRIGSIVAFALSGLFILAAVWMFLNRQYVLDQLSVWSYEPSAAVVSIGDRAKFTDKATFIFYATQPAIAEPSAFNRACPRQEPGSPILGCYTPEDRIYVYDLTNEQLDGMEEVTAAHEMLHAVWYRMGSEEKKRITTELRAAYDKLENTELKERISYYERTEPGELNNELHSILGTEVESLGEPLESYYSQYFDRGTVLKLHQQYSAVYNGLYSRADELFIQMESLSASLQSRSAAYQSAVSQLSADISSFNARANRGSFSSQRQFNAERASLISRTNALERERQSLNDDIATYNEYYAEYQEIAEQIEVLNSSIDSFKQIEQTPSV